MTIFWGCGPIAQWLEQGTHNPLVTGSSPVGPTTLVITLHAKLGPPGHFGTKGKLFIPERIYNFPPFFGPTCCGIGILMVSPQYTQRCMDRLVYRMLPLTP